MLNKKLEKLLETLHNLKASLEKTPEDDVRRIVTTHWYNILIRLTQYILPLSEYTDNKEYSKKALDTFVYNNTQAVRTLKDAVTLYIAVAGYEAIEAPFINAMKEPLFDLQHSLNKSLEMLKVRLARFYKRGCNG
jgi:hypothetical protein